MTEERGRFLLLALDLQEIATKIQIKKIEVADLPAELDSILAPWGLAVRKDDEEVADNEAVHRVV